MTHKLKTDMPVFKAVLDGLKTYEIRYNDRAYRKGDTLLLRETLYTGEEMNDEYNPAPLVYTGREIKVKVTHVLRGPIYGLADKWVIMSFKEAKP